MKLREKWKGFILTLVYSFQFLQNPLKPARKTQIGNCEMSSHSKQTVSRETNTGSRVHRGEDHTVRANSDYYTTMRNQKNIYYYIFCSSLSHSVSGQHKSLSDCINFLGLRSSLHSLYISKHLSFSLWKATCCLSPV